MSSKFYLKHLTPRTVFSTVDPQVFKYQDLTQWLFELRFLMSPATTSSTSKYQVLASNCHSKAKPWDLSEVTQDLTPSLAIIADTVNQQLLFLAYSDDLNVKPVKIYLPYEVSVFRKRYRGILIISESELKSNQT